MKSRQITAITGGIGAGKSVVCDMLRVMGYEVFDCDSEAKQLMDNDADIKCRLNEEIHPSAVRADGTIDRERIASIVFADNDKLNTLNNIVHHAVRKRIGEWADEKTDSDRLFVETAILYQSGLDKIADDVLEIIAPERIRILRVIKRNGCDEATVRSRIESQKFIPAKPHPRITEIVNDGFEPVIPQLQKYLSKNHL